MSESPAGDPTRVKVRDQLLHDVFMLGVGNGILRWATVLDWHDHLHLFDATIVDPDLRTRRIDRTTIVLGMQAAVFTWRDRIPWSIELPPSIFDDYQGWEFTPFDADLIIQLGLYAEVPYTERRLRSRGLLPPAGKILDKPATV